MLIPCIGRMHGFVLQVFPQEYRQIEPAWSTISMFNLDEKPYSAQDGNSPSVPGCVSMPQQPILDESISYTRRQIALICTFDSAETSARTAYLVRIDSGGVRMPVVFPAHASPTGYAAAPGTYCICECVQKRHQQLTVHSTSGSQGLFFDVAFNVVYWSLFQTWNVPYSQNTEGKAVYKITLYPDYDIKNVETVPSLSVPNQNLADYPLGISLEAASMEPADGGTLFAFIVHKNELRLFKLLAVQQTEGTEAGFARASEFLPLSVDDGIALRSIEKISWSLPAAKYTLPAKFFFTLHGRLFLQMPYYGPMVGANDVYLVGSCQSCPAGLTSLGSLAKSEDMCRCPDGSETYWNKTLMKCVPLLQSCNIGSYFSMAETTIDNRYCSECRSCPEGICFVKMHTACIVIRDGALCCKRVIKSIMLMQASIVCSIFHSLLGRQLTSVAMDSSILTPTLHTERRLHAAPAASVPGEHTGTLLPAAEKGRRTSIPATPSTAFRARRAPTSTSSRTSALAPPPTTPRRARRAHQTVPTERTSTMRY